MSKYLYFFAFVLISYAILKLLGLDIGRKLVDTSHVTDIDSFHKIYFGLALIVFGIINDYLKKYNDKVNLEDSNKKEENK